MATAELPARSGVSLEGAASLANLFLGKSGSSTGTSQNSGGLSTTSTTTNSESVSPDAVNALVKSILEGTQGLAAVSSGQKRAGLYNSSTNQLLTNDLVARAAAEGAKLNKTSTQTTTQTQADNRSTTTNNTTVQNPQIPTAVGATGAGILGALSLVPTDTKQKILNALGLGTKAAGAVKDATADAPTDAADAISAAYSDPSRALDVENPIALDSGAQSVSSLLPGSNIATVGQNVDDQFIQSISQYLVPDASSLPAEAVGAAATDVVSGVGSDFLGGSSDGGSLDFSGFSDGLGNVGDFVGETVAGLGDSVGNFFDDFDFGGFFAEGGLVKKSDGKESIFERRRAAIDAAEEGTVEGKSTNDEFQKRMNAQTKEERKGSFFSRIIPTFKDGGIVRTADIRKGYASGGIVDLTNTGLRNKGAGATSPLGVAGDNQQITDAVVKSLTGAATPTSNKSSAGTGSTNTAGLNIAPGTPKVAGSSAAPRTRVAPDDREGGAGDANGPGAGTTPGAPNSGIGVTSGVASAGLGLAGISAPGLAGLATATNNSQAVNSAVSAIASIVASPVVGLVVNALLNNTASDNPNSDANADTANAASAINDTDPLDTLVGIIDAQINGVNGAATQGTGVSDSQGAGVGDSSGNAVGTDGDGGVGAGGEGGPGTGGVGGGSGAAGGDSYNSGGEVSGPGTSTSDSILARLSDGEFVVNAAAVDALGVDFLEAINNAWKPQKIQSRGAQPKRGA